MRKQGYLGQLSVTLLFNWDEQYEQYICKVSQHSRRNRHFIHHIDNQQYTFRIPDKESRPVAGKPHDTAAVLFGLKLADSSHYKFKSS